MVEIGKVRTMDEPGVLCTSYGGLERPFRQREKDIVAGFKLYGTNSTTRGHRCQPTESAFTPFLRSHRRLFSAIPSFRLDFVGTRWSRFGRASVIFEKRAVEGLCAGCRRTGTRPIGSPFRREKQLRIRPDSRLRPSRSRPPSRRSASAPPVS